MALNVNQIADILFKKIADGKATTEFGRFYGNGEEPYSGRSFVDLSQIWVESNLIPSVASEVANIVVKINNIQLTNIPGSSSFTHASLKNVIPFNYGDGLSYTYTLKRNDGATVIPPGGNDWYLDTETGVLTFFFGDTATPGLPGTLPTGVSTVSGPYITCYKYVGKTALDTGLSGGSGSANISMGEWQNSVYSLITSLPGSSVNGDRYIWNSTSGTNANIINPSTEVVTLGTINPYDIIDWYATSSGTAGWVNIPATTGMFTSIDSLSNAIYFYNTTNKWSKYEGEKTYPTELVLIAQDTFTQEVDNYDHVISDTTVVQEGTPDSDYNLSINGIKTTDNSFDIRPLINRALSYSSSTIVDITFSSIGSASLGDPIRILTSTEIIWRVVKAINTNTITFTGTPILSITGAQVYSKDTVSLYPHTGDYILVKYNLGFDIESGLDPDNLSLTYVRPIV